MQVLGHVGEPENAATLYAVGTSCMLRRPLGAEIVAPSSAGKSHLSDTVLGLFPSEIIDRATSASEHALYYKTCDLRHKIVVRAERDLRAEEQFGSLAFRELMSSGYVERDVVLKNPSTNGFETRKISVEGPVAYVETTTSTKRLDEDESRMVRLVSDESPEQTARVHWQTARDAAHPAAKVETERERVRAMWRALHLLVRREALGDRPLQVVVPYAEQIATGFPKGSLRTRRLLPQVLALVKVVALLRVRHHTIREDCEDRILEADQEDYRQARVLARPLVQRALARLDEKTVELLRLLRGECPRPRQFTTQDAARLQGMSERDGTIATQEAGGGRTPRTPRPGEGRSRGSSVAGSSGTARPTIGKTTRTPSPTSRFGASFRVSSRATVPRESAWGAGERRLAKPGRTWPKPGSSGFPVALERGEPVSQAGERARGRETRNLGRRGNRGYGPRRRLGGRSLERRGRLPPRAPLRPGRRGRRARRPTLRARHRVRSPRRAAPDAP